MPGIESGDKKKDTLWFSIRNAKGCIRKLEMTSLTFSTNKRWTHSTPLALQVHIISHVFGVIRCCRSGREKRILKRKRSDSVKPPLLKFLGNIFAIGTVTCLL